MLGERVKCAGKFLVAGREKFIPKGVSYGTFAPNAQNEQFPSLKQVSADFALMRSYGVNTVRTYTVPDQSILDEAARAGLRVMVGIPWAQHVAFLDDAQDRPRHPPGRREGCDGSFADHPAVLMFALGNEIPASVVRWHGQARVERFLRELYDEGKAACAGQPVHLRELPADRVPRAAVSRCLRVQRLPAQRS